jgi:rare lipoprotein A
MRLRPLTDPAFRLIIAVGLSAVLHEGCAAPLHHVDRFPGYPVGFVERGMASWYGPGFHGNKTANGERYDMYALTAAHRTLPLGSVAVVHSLTSGRHVSVRINDRGPFAKGRILDLSLAGAQALLARMQRDFADGRIIQTDLPEGRRYRVRIGRFSDEPEARKASMSLDRMFHFQSFVVRDDDG